MQILDLEEPAYEAGDEEEEEEGRGRQGGRVAEVAVAVAGSGVCQSHVHTFIGDVYWRTLALTLRLAF